MSQFDGFPKDFFTFFNELKNNNNRDWFASNKPRYFESVVHPMGDYMTRPVAMPTRPVSTYISKPTVFGTVAKLNHFVTDALELSF